VNVLVVSGIWPPDVGGPASHAPALARHLHARRHGVEVVTTAAAAPPSEPFPVHWVRRSLPRGVRHADVVRLVARHSHRADVVYATSMVRRAAAGAGVVRRPLAVKLVADEAFERAQRGGEFSGTLEEFQSLPGGRRLRALRSSRSAALRRAVLVLSPSAYLREIALGWGLDPARVIVVPNPAPPVPALPPRDELRAELGVDGTVLAFAGRLTLQKALDLALDALREVPQVTLLVLGDGPDRGRLERGAAERGLGGRVRFLGAGSRDDVLRLFSAADAALLTSAWENLPHTVLEALAVGTPVIATAVGGVPEVVRDGENGLLVPPASPEALRHAVERFRDDAALRARLRAAAAPSVAHLAEEPLLERIERLLEDVVAR
jgi:glycosyltransferase involved in cell wall biosynthesis